MLKQGVFADRLVHAQMHETLLVGEGIKSKSQMRIGE